MFSVLGFLVAAFLCTGPVIFSLILWWHIFLKTFSHNRDKIMERMF